MSEILNLTNKQKEECQKILDCLLEYWWNRFKLKMDTGMSFEVASLELQEEILNE